MKRTGPSEQGKQIIYNTKLKKGMTVLPELSIQLDLSRKSFVFDSKPNRYSFINSHYIIYEFSRKEKVWERIDSFKKLSRILPGKYILVLISKSI